MQGYYLGSKSISVESRRNKAKKVILILERHRDIRDAVILDIGTGSGYIANELSKVCKNVKSIDIVDDRKTDKGYEYKKVNDENIPYKDSTFDVVVSNQVLEHVNDQDRHLREMARVLKNDGIVYLATPNKWWVTDPHYKLPFISWLPRGLAGYYLRVTRKRRWDIFSVSLHKLKKLSNRRNFALHDETWEVMSNPKKYQVNFPSVAAILMRATPPFLRKFMLAFVPTHIKILTQKID